MDLQTQLQLQCKDIDHCRTLQNIVWTCLSTIFLCAWVAIHPDIPKTRRCGSRRSDTGWRKQIGFAIVALFAPEMVLIKAFNDWIMSCRMLKEIHYQVWCEWSEVHAHFARMGGFCIARPDGTKQQMFGDEILVEAFEKHSIEIPDVTKKEIEDRSKADGFAKALVALQTTYFIIQCIHRAARHLPLTALEITTLTHTASNLAIYFFWWSKPLKVNVPIEIKALQSEEPEPEPENESGQPRKKPLVLRLDNESIVEGTRRYITLPLRIRIGSYIGMLLSIPWAIWPTLLAYGTIGSLLSAIHFFAWKYPFPTHAELIFWRVSAHIVIIAPGFAYALGNWSLVAAALFVGIYGLARLSLYVLALLALRSMPYEEYLALSLVVVLTLRQGGYIYKALRC